MTSSYIVFILSALLLFNGCSITEPAEPATAIDNTHLTEPSDPDTADIRVLAEPSEPDTDDISAATESLKHNSNNTVANLILSHLETDFQIMWFIVFYDDDRQNPLPQGRFYSTALTTLTDEYLFNRIIDTLSNLELTPLAASEAQSRIGSHISIYLSGGIEGFTEDSIAEATLFEVVQMEVEASVHLNVIIYPSLNLLITSNAHPNLPVLDRADSQTYYSINISESELIYALIEPIMPYHENLFAALNNL